jgi:hypothetical protein
MKKEELRILQDKKNQTNPLPHPPTLQPTNPLEAAQLLYHHQNKQTNDPHESVWVFLHEKRIKLGAF